MSEIIQAIVKRSSIFLIVIGVILLIGASGDINFGSFPSVYQTQLFNGLFS